MRPSARGFSTQGTPKGCRIGLIIRIVSGLSLANALKGDIGVTGTAVSGLLPPTSLRWLRATVSGPGSLLRGFPGSEPSRCRPEFRCPPWIRRAS
jgi:hypothetical protein